MLLSLDVFDVPLSRFSLPVVDFCLSRRYVCLSDADRTNFVGSVSSNLSDCFLVDGGESTESEDVGSMPVAALSLVELLKYSSAVVDSSVWMPIPSLTSVRDISIFSITLVPLFPPPLDVTYV